jgi:hypothetical protein
VGKKKKWPHLDQAEDPAEEALVAAQKERLLRITQQAVDDMGICSLGIRVNVAFHGGYFGGWDQGAGEDLTTETTAATTTTNFQYQTAQIIWYLPPTYNQADSWLYEIAVHELAHVLASPVKDVLMDHPMHEYYTEWIARALLAMKESDAGS